MPRRRHLPNPSPQLLRFLWCLVLDRGPLEPIPLLKPHAVVVCVCVCMCVCVRVLVFVCFSGSCGAQDLQMCGGGLTCKAFRTGAFDCKLQLGGFCAM